MSKHEALKKVIQALRENVPDISGVIIASTEGLSIATDFSEDEAVRLAAVSAAASGLSDRVAKNAALDGAEEVMVKGREGLLLIYAVGSTGVLAVRAPARGNLGLVQLEANVAAKEVRDILG